MPPYIENSINIGKDIIMPLDKLLEFLDSNNIKYIRLGHSQAFSAQEIAASAHIPGKGFAKTVIIKIDERMAMAILPASYKIDFDMLKKGIAISFAYPTPPCPNPRRYVGE